MESSASTSDDDDTGVTRRHPCVRTTGDLGETRHVRFRDTLLIGRDIDFPIRNVGLERMDGSGCWSVFDVSGADVETRYEGPS